MFLKVLIACHDQGYALELKGIKRKVTTTGVLIVTAVNDYQYPTERLHTSAEEAYTTAGWEGLFI